MLSEGKGGERKKIRQTVGKGFFEKPLGSPQRLIEK